MSISLTPEIEFPQSLPIIQNREADQLGQIASDKVGIAGKPKG